MDKSTIYILAILIGAIIGIISMVFKKKKLPANESPNDNRQRVSVSGNDIHIKNDDLELRKTDVEIQPVILLISNRPTVNVFEDGKHIRSFTIEPRENNLELHGQFFHSSIRVNSNSSVQIDGYISKHESKYESTDEGIRFQPFFLSDKDENNNTLKGKGMFQRGLHYPGLISNGNIRLICVCDQCKKSFTIEFFHAGFSEIQYFYSSNSKETLIVPYNNRVGKVPTQLQEQIDQNELKELEEKLPKSNDGQFKYYNSFKCPHCGDDYIDFKANKELRPKEYYVNYYINQDPIRVD